MRRSEATLKLISMRLDERPEFLFGEVCVLQMGGIKGEWGAGDCPLDMTFLDLKDSREIRLVTCDLSD